MTFNAMLDSIQQPGDTCAIDVNVTYTDTDYPDWRVSKTIRITIDPLLSTAEQSEAIWATITTDAQLYQAQMAAYAGQVSLVGQSIEITPP